jgi:hypothetical protein
VEFCGGASAVRSGARGYLGALVELMGCSSEERVDVVASWGAASSALPSELEEF